MPTTAGSVCTIVAIILFILAAIPVVDIYHPRLVAIGLAFFALGHVLG